MADSNGIFEKVDPGVRLYRSRFRRRFQKLIDAHFGRLYPILADVMMPGDIVKPGLRWNIKANPSVTPYFTRVRGSVFYFAVPMRMIYGTDYGDKSDTFFEDIITGGKDGDNSDSLPLLTDPAFFCDFGGKGSKFLTSYTPNLVKRVDSLPDSNLVERYLVTLSNCFGFPTFRLDSSASVYPGPIKYPPCDYFHRAYWRIVTDYFIDEDTMPGFVDWRFNSSLGNSVPVGDTFFWTHVPMATLWSRDYFMSALKDFLKGTPPALDIGSVQYPGYSGQTSPSYVYFGQNIDDHNGDLKRLPISSSSGDLAGLFPAYSTGASADSPLTGYSAAHSFSVPAVSLPAQGAFGVDEMRLAFATQRILERANRVGTRYTEYLLSTFNAAPSDGTLQRPWYLGGVRFNIVTPEVLQTSESGSTPQGTRSGSGFSVGQGRLHTYRCKEWSVLMAVLNIEPDATYCDGVPRQARYRSRWDFFNPSMQNLSEQIVQKGEIWSDVTNSDLSYDPKEGFGYQGMWNELRTKMDEVSGNFRYTELDNWHMALRFNTKPVLSVFFKRIISYFSNIMRPFAVQSMPPFLCSFYHDNIWVRPMVRHPVPGLIDHN